MQILANELCDQKYSPNMWFTFIPIYFFFMMNSDLKTVTVVIKAFLI